MGQKFDYYSSWKTIKCWVQSHTRQSKKLQNRFASLKWHGWNCYFKWATSNGDAFDVTTLLLCRADKDSDPYYSNIVPYPKVTAILAMINMYLLLAQKSSSVGTPTKQNIDKQKVNTTTDTNESTKYRHNFRQDKSST